MQEDLSHARVSTIRVGEVMQGVLSSGARVSVMQGVLSMQEVLSHARGSVYARGSVMQVVLSIMAATTPRCINLMQGVLSSECS